MSKLSVVISLVVVPLAMVSCAPDSGPSSPVPSPDRELRIESRHRTPMLSGTPIWSVDGPLEETGTCFGMGIAVGDFDGDGYRDVVVGEAACFGAPVMPGRLAVFRGSRSGPSTVPVFTDLDWQNSLRGGTPMTLSVGDVDGDRRDDLLVNSRAGAQVFAGIRNLGAPLGSPSFRVPGTGPFGAALLADVNGDHKADIIATKGGVTTVWLSTPRAAAGAFTAARALPNQSLVQATDTNRDGKADVLVFNSGGSQLLLGCRAHERDCDGGLRGRPAWTTPLFGIGMVPDINHDGLAEAILAPLDLIIGGRLGLYLSDGATGLSTTPAWQTLVDPGYAIIQNVAAPGDIDGDHRATEFVIAGGGRFYAFFPTLATLPELQPAFAWPREDFVQDQIDAGNPLFSPITRVLVGAGDVNRDGIDDIAIGDAPFDEGRRGHAYLFAGGAVPAGDPPFLPGAATCSAPDTGKPDLTVDAAALARTLVVEHVDFPATSCAISERCIGGPGVRRLLRFATVFVNAGNAPLIVPGPDARPDLYHLNSCEGELELDGFAEYQLIDTAGGTIATGRKQTVLPLDIQPTCIGAGPGKDYFPDSGISPGWSDIYPSYNFCQWLDTTDVPDGRYTLRLSVDVNHILDQADAEPDTVSVDVELAGDHVTVLR